jgi:hypothetical protein
MRPSAGRAIAEKIEIAWAHLGRSSGDLDMPDLIAHADIDANWSDYRTNLVKNILDGNCYPSHLEVVDLPKDRLAVRPLARMSPEHRLAYDAAVFAAADQIESTVPRGVYSYRWWKGKQRLLGAQGMWIKMQRSARYLHAQHPSLLLARTDVTAFYEHIEPDILIEDFKALDVPNWSGEVLDGFLRAFNGLSNAWGIPQGSDASGMLANLYLIPLDVEIKRRGFRHYRYSDDVYIFGEDWISLREVILEANKILRHRHLNLSGSKTKIIGHRDVAAQFEDTEKDAISYGVSAGKPESIQELYNFFDTISAKDPVSSRDLKYSLTQLGSVLDDYAAAWLIANMGEIPHIAREALVYLSKLPWLASHTSNAVVELITNSKLIIYPYAEQHLLIYMINNKVLSPRGLEAAWNLLLDKNKESFVREFAARYLGLYSPPGSASRLKQEFQQESNPRVRRALLVACYESGQCSERWLHVISKSDPDLYLTAQYLSSRPIRLPLPIVEKMS